MKPSLILAGLLVVTLATSSVGGIFDRGEKGNGDMTTKTYDLDDCHAVRLECGLDIEISFGDGQRVALVMDENLLKLYELKARGGTLVISAEDDPRPSRKAKLELVLRELDQVEIDGAGDIEIAGYDDDELTIDIDGAGDLEADGKVKDLVIELSGAGDIDFRDLHAEHATVTVNGAGDVTVHASKSCEVTINGVGDVDVYGKPDKFDKTVHGIGDIQRK